MQYGFVIDQTACIGCHACTVACKTEHDVPLGVDRTWVKYIEAGTWPDTKRSFSVMRCNHCTDAPCVSICPTNALFRRDDGIVDFDTSLCIGCKSCMQACPYDALYIDPHDHTAQKCNYCVHRVEVGLEPACVVVCPEGAIISGDLDDPTTPISQLVHAERMLQRSTEQGTGPNLWYRGADEAAIDPLGAVDPGDGGIWRDPAASFMTVDLTPRDEPGAKGRGKKQGTRHRPGRDNPPRVVYNTDHPMPWGWRVSSYFLTKGISAGIVMVLALSLLSGAGVDNPFARWGAPLIAGIFLALTGVLLVWDLKRPDRFHYLLTKGNPGSWLVKGAWILAAQAVILGLWFFFGLAGAGFLPVFIWAGAVVGLGVAGYTAFPFGQAEGRDLWQSPTLLWHMLAGAFAVGGGAGLLAAAAFDLEPAVPADLRLGPRRRCGCVGSDRGGRTRLETPDPQPRSRDAPPDQGRPREGVVARGPGDRGRVMPLVLGAVFLAGTGVPLWVAELGGLAAPGRHLVRRRRLRQGGPGGAALVSERGGNHG